MNIVTPSTIVGNPGQQAKTPSTDDGALGAIVQDVIKTFRAPGANDHSTWVSFALMTGHAAFAVSVAVPDVPTLLNALSSATVKAGLLDVQFYLQKRTSRDAAGLELICGVTLDIDKPTVDPLVEVELAGIPIPTAHFLTAGGYKLLYVFEGPASEPVAAEVGARIGLGLEGIDGASWLTSQAQRLPEVLKTTPTGVVHVQHAALLSNAVPLAPDPGRLPFPHRLLRALGAFVPSPGDRQLVRDYLQQIGIPVPSSPGSALYDACPVSQHSNKCCYVNLQDDGAVSVVCLAGHGGTGRCVWKDPELLRLAGGISEAHAPTFDPLKDLPVTWATCEYVGHRLQAWPTELRRAALDVWLMEKARREAPDSKFVDDMIALYKRRVEGDAEFGRVHLHYDLLGHRLAYDDAAGRTYEVNCAKGGPNTQANLHECLTTAATRLTVVKQDDGTVTTKMSWRGDSESLFNKAVMGQRHALRVLGVPAMERHVLPAAFDEESWAIEPRTKVVAARVPFAFPSHVVRVPALPFFLRLHAQGRLPLATANDVRLFAACIAQPLLRFQIPGLLGIYWFLGAPGSGKDYLAELPPLIWSSVNPHVPSVKFDLSVTDDLEQKRSLASAGDAVYGRAKEAGKRAGLVERLIQLGGTDALVARQVYAPEHGIGNTFTIIADSAEDLPERREISRRTVAISVVDISDDVSKGQVREEIRAAAPGLLLDLLLCVESQGVTTYTHAAQANTRPIGPVALARLFGATLPEVRGEDLTDIFEAMRDFALSANGKTLGEIERKKAVAREGKESAEAKAFPSYPLAVLVETVRAQMGGSVLFGKNETGTSLANRLLRESSYADVRAGKRPFLPVRIGGVDYGFKLVRSNRNFVLVPADEFVRRMAAVQPDAVAVDVTAAAAAPAPATQTFTFDDSDVLERKG